MSIETAKVAEQPNIIVNMPPLPEVKQPLRESSAGQLERLGMRIALGLILTLAMGWVTIKAAANSKQGLDPAIQAAMGQPAAPSYPPPAPAYQPQQVYVAAPTQAAPPAPAPAGNQMKFLVQGTGKAGERIFLNNLADYRDPNCQTIVLQGPAFANFNHVALKGRVVTGTGTAGNYKGKAQVVVTNPADLRVE